MSPTIRWYLADGAPIEAHNQRVTPRSRVLEVRLTNAAFVWQRPTQVVVQSADGRIVRTPIADVTRVAQLSLFVLASVLVMLARRSGS